MRNIVGVFVSIFSALVFGSAHAQSGNRDYYGPRVSRDDQTLFGQVESYHLQQGVEHLRAREYRAAQGDFEFILYYYPNHPRVLVLFSDLCEQTRSQECVRAADAWFEKAVAVNPNAATTYIALGIHNQRNHRLEDAIKAYKRALELSPNSVNANYNLGLAYFERKEYALANEAAQRAYAAGAPLPGLRDKLKTVGAWRPVESGDSPPAESAPSKSAPDGRSAK